jgi:hypothetical protein
MSQAGNALLRGLEWSILPFIGGTIDQSVNSAWFRFAR